MKFSIPLLYDFLFLLVFSFAAVRSWRKGFLSGLAEVVGTVVAVGAAVWVSRNYAGALFDDILSGAVTDRITAVLENSNGDLAAALQGLDFLPDAMRTALVAVAANAGSELPAKITAALQPLLLPFVQVLIFVVLIVVLRWVFRLLTGLLRGINGVPVLGGVNRLLGLCFGLVIGAFDCWLLALACRVVAMMTLNQLSWLNTRILSQSIAFGIFGSYNPFMPTVG